jgi:hypothetical protein
MKPPGQERSENIERHKKDNDGGHQGKDINLLYPGGEVKIATRFNLETAHLQAKTPRSPRSPPTKRPLSGLHALTSPRKEIAKPYAMISFII